MGSNADSRIVELAGRSAVDAFRTLTSQLAHEHGHGGYTGTLAEKHDYAIVAESAAADLATVRTLARAIEAYDFGPRPEDDDEGEWVADPLVAATEEYCRSCYGRKTVRAKADATLPDGRVVRVDVDEPCDACAGRGRVPLDSAKAAAEAARIAELHAALAVFRIGRRELMRARELFDDKWGPAVLVVGATHLYAGGYCSS